VSAATSIASPVWTGEIWLAALDDFRNWLILTAARLRA
jgi:hypothetical protein